MRSFPRTVNNKQDVTNLMSKYPVETKAYLQNILDNKDQWMMTSKLADGVVGITDATHKVMESTDENDVVTERHQSELMEDPNGELYRLGYANVAEIEGAI